MNGLSDEIGVTLKHRRAVFANSRFTVYCDHIAGGDLEVEDFMVVVPHVRRDDLLTGVAVVPVRNHSVLLLRTYRHPIGQQPDLAVGGGFPVEQRDQAGRHGGDHGGPTIGQVLDCEGDPPDHGGASRHGRDPLHGTRRARAPGRGP